MNLTLDNTNSLDHSVVSGEEGYLAAGLSLSLDDTEMDINLEAMETPSDSESCTFPDSMHELEWEGERKGEGGSKRARETNRWK